MLRNLSVLFVIFTQALAFGELPPVVQRSLDVKVEFGECQKEIVADASLHRQVSIAGDSNELLFIPCAQWAYNMRWMSFLLVKNREGKIELVKPLYFPHFSQFSGFHANDYVENMRWSDESNRLFSHHYLNGRAECGEMVLYKYDPKYQKFKTLEILHNEDCTLVDMPWLSIWKDADVAQ